MSENKRSRSKGWKIYFIIFILFRAMVFFENPNPISIIFGVLHLFLSTTILYSWIWIRPIGWLANPLILILIKIWAIQFFIAPVALILHGILALTKGNPNSIDWLITIVISYPALYILWRVGWKDELPKK